MVYRLEIKEVHYVRRDGGPTLVPRGGPFTFSYTLHSTDPTGSPQEALLGALLDRYHQIGYAGRFRLVRTPSSGSGRG